MTRARWLIVVVTMVSVSLSLNAGEVPAGLRSRLAVQHHLFAGTTSPLPPSLATDAPDDSPQKKSVGLAVISSLILPGMGELYGGSLGTGKYFLIAEGVLWLTYATFGVYGDALRDDARAFAVARAGITTAGKNDQYYIDIGNFLDLNQYNDKKLRDREPSRLYDPAAGFWWAWDTDASRASYRNQRIASENMFNNQKFVLAALLINHVASAINAARSAISHNEQIAGQDQGLRLRADLLGVPGNPRGVMITLVKPF
jgi:TM2 domain-containing membrane protein YozV